MVDVLLKNKKCPICYHSMNDNSPVNSLFFCNWKSLRKVTSKEYHYLSYYVSNDIIQKIFLSFKMELKEINLRLNFETQESFIYIYDGDQSELYYERQLQKLLQPDFPDLTVLKERISKYLDLLVFL